METETIKSKRRLSQSMGSLYLLEDEEVILKRPNVSRGYVMALFHKRNLYSYSFAQCDNSHEVGGLDQIIDKFRYPIIPIPFDVDDTKRGNSQELENYLNQHFGNNSKILRTEKGIELFQNNSNSKIKSLLMYQKKLLSLNIKEALLFYTFFGNIPLIKYVISD